MKELNFDTIGRNIRKCRLEKKLTQEYVAYQTGVNVSHISNIENNRVKVSLTALVAICNALHVTVDYILDSEYIASSALDQEILKELDGKSDERKEQILQIIKILK
jgi:transcriptional regulator with XRE-family HTH domain